MVWIHPEVLKLLTKLQKTEQMHREIEALANNIPFFKDKRIKYVVACLCSWCFAFYWNVHTYVWAPVVALHFFLVEYTLSHHCPIQAQSLMEKKISGIHHLHNLRRDHPLLLKFHHCYLLRRRIAKDLVSYGPFSFSFYVSKTVI